MAKKAPDALKILWEKKFFMKNKSLKQVEEELHGLGYNFGDATRKALERADFILPQGTRGDRKFIQKYPYVSEEHDGLRKKGK